MSEVSNFILHRVVINSDEDLRVDFTVIGEIFFSTFKSNIVEVWQDNIRLSDYPHGECWVLAV